MVCVCGTVFCWDDADLTITGAQEKLYCSETCKNRAYRARVAEKRRQNVCKKRGKVPYPKVSAARAAAARQFTSHGRVLYPYPCQCGSWHLTKKPNLVPDEWEHPEPPVMDSPAFRNWLARNG